MPKTAIDYSNTVIYKIVCNDLNVTDVYVGHTTDFRKRKCAHKSNCSNENNKVYNFKIYQTIRENDGWSNWSMIEVEKYPCNDGNEAREKERYWFETLNANMNTNVPSRTQDEYRKVCIEENKKEIKEYHRARYERIKEELKEKHRLYREENKEKIKEKARVYREEYRDETNKYYREYYKEHKEEINQKRKKL
jgi:hypothetical protein